MTGRIILLGDDAERYIINDFRESNHVGLATSGRSCVLGVVRFPSELSRFGYIFPL
jgi:hypothetical protein